MFWISIFFQVNVTNIREKCVVTLLGHKIHLSCSVTKDLDDKENKVENPIQMLEMTPLNSRHDDLEEFDDIWDKNNDDKNFEIQESPPYSRWRCDGLKAYIHQVLLQKAER